MATLKPVPRRKPYEILHASTSIQLRDRSACKSIYVCIMDQAGAICVHKNLPAQPEAFLCTIAPYRDDLVVAVECIFTWYWITDLCNREGIAFVLGHALYMKAIHGGKTKNDKIDSQKIAALLRGVSYRRGNFFVVRAKFAS